MTTPKKHEQHNKQTLLTKQISLKDKNKSHLNSAMKLSLILLAALLNLVRGEFMAELTGSLTAEPCTGDEYADFKQCLPANVADEQEEALFSRGGDRSLGWCSGCRGGAPRGTFCFTVCGGRRRLEEGTTNLRHLQDGTDAEYKAGAYSGTGLALEYATEIIDCLGTVSATHLCLGDTADMKLVITA
jgi:hypothetical protein